MSVPAGADRCKLLAAACVTYARDLDILGDFLNGALGCPLDSAGEKWVSNQWHSSFKNMLDLCKDLAKYECQKPMQCP
jgi:hypothetical protein